MDNRPKCCISPLGRKKVEELLSYSWDHEIPKVQSDRMEFDQDFVCCQLWNWHFCETEAIKALVGTCD